MPVIDGQLVCVEGKLDAAILNILLAKAEKKFIIKRRGYKSTLKLVAETLAQEEKDNVYFLRDRDFDYLPPNDLFQPKQINPKIITIELPNNQKITKEVKGWHWCLWHFTRMESFDLLSAIEFSEFGTPLHILTKVASTCFVHYRSSFLKRKPIEVRCSISKMEYNEFLKHKKSRIVEEIRCVLKIRCTLYRGKKIDKTVNYFSG